MIGGMTPWAHLQDGYDVRFEWGAGGAETLGAVPDLADCCAHRERILDAPIPLGSGPAPVFTGGDDQASWSRVVLLAGRVGTTTSRRVRRWARGTV